MAKQLKKNNDLSEILRPYDNMWVALSKDGEKVIEAGKTLKQLFEKLKGKDYREFEFMKVPDFRMSYAPYI